MTIYFLPFVGNVLFGLFCGIMLSTIMEEMSTWANIIVRLLCMSPVIYFFLSFEAYVPLTALLLGYMTPAIPFHRFIMVKA